MLLFIHLCLESQVVAEPWLLIQCRMAQGGWHQGSAGTTYYRGGSDSSAWPTWTQVQGAGAAAGETPASGADRDEEPGRSQEPASASDHPYWRAQPWESTSWGGGGRYNGDWQWGWWSSGSGTQGRLQRSSCLGRLVQLPLVEEIDDSMEPEHRRSGVETL